MDYREEDDDDFIYGPSTGEPTAIPHFVPVLGENHNDCFNGM